MTGPRAPRIAATTYREPAAWGVWHESADVLHTSYAASIEAAGGVAMLLPPSDPRHAGTVLDAVDGLVLTGGGDVDPARYAASPHPSTGAPRADRDAWELALAEHALARDLPLLAICRGMQVLNVALGGDLLQHLPDAVGSDIHCPVVGEHGRHAVALAPGSRLAGMVGTRTTVATYHHQGVHALGHGLQACGWADDGLVEAVELPGRRWVLGVQWHPEAYEGHELFRAFVAACRPASVQ